MTATIHAFPARPERRRAPVMVATRPPQASLHVLASLCFCLAVFAPGVLVLLGLLWGFA